MSLTEYPDFKPDIEFKSPPMPRLIATIVVVIAGLALVATSHFPVFKFKLPMWWTYPVAGMLGLIRLLSFQTYRKALRPTNWLLRASGNRQWIKFRTFMNDHLPAKDPQIIELERADIAWVRTTQIKIIYFSGSNAARERVQSHQRIICLDIGLDGIDTGPLDVQLKREEQHPGAGAHGFTGKYNNYPVSVPEPGVIRLRWRDHYDRISPGVDLAVEFFARWARTLPAENITMDYRPAAFAELPEPLRCIRLRELSQIDKMAANGVARELNKSSLADAMTYVKSL